MVATVRRVALDINLLYCTVDVDRITGLNVYGFNLIKVFMDILSHCLGQKCLFSVVKESVTYIHGKTSL